MKEAAAFLFSFPPARQKCRRHAFQSVQQRCGIRVCAGRGGAGLPLWCGWRESNPHAFRRWNLNPVRLPVPPHPLWMSGRPSKSAPLYHPGGGNQRKNPAATARFGAKPARRPRRLARQLVHRLSTAAQRAEKMPGAKNDPACELPRMSGLLPPISCKRRRCASKASNGVVCALHL